MIVARADLHSIVVAELDRRDMSPVASTSNQHMSIFNTPSYARTLGKPW